MTHNFECTMCQTKCYEATYLTFNEYFIVRECRMENIKL